MKAYGVITGQAENGDFIGNINRPIKIEGVFLPAGSLCLTKAYPGESNKFNQLQD